MAAMLSSITLVLANSSGGRLLPRPKPELKKTVSLNVPSLHCETCLSNLMDAISDLDGITPFEGEAESKLVVRYRGPRAFGDRIGKKVAEAGHTVG